jgi:hypothetical protein
VIYAFMPTDSAVTITATDPASDLNAPFTWTRIRARR